jgi:hypothetical protein
MLIKYMKGNSNISIRFIYSSQRIYNTFVLKMPKRKSSSSDDTPAELPNASRKKQIAVASELQPLPQRNADGELIFLDHPEFSPNLTPEEVLKSGSFGGTYFRKIYSSITKQTHDKSWEELPPSWLQGLNISRQVASATYDASVNTYKVECGNDLEFWETSGWITAIDPFGWFQWYCRFYQGRRCDDDRRQISRGLGVMGPNGRWRNFLANKCIHSGKSLRMLSPITQSLRK